MLARYARVFDAVEINSSFYRPHRRATYERWAGSTPDGFRFAAKLPRAITHGMRLVLKGPDLDAFLDQTAGLGPKRGPILIQLPPSLAFRAEVADAFFRTMRGVCDANLACEPRHPSWFAAEAGDLLSFHKVARVAADPAIVPQATEFGGWPGLRYVRLHGSPEIYHSNYGPDALAAIVARIKRPAVETWCVFDNTALGAATANALDARAACGS